MEANPAISALCVYCEKMNSRKRKKAAVEDPELALKDLKKMDKLLFAIGLAVFSDYEEREKGGDCIRKKQEMCVPLGKN